MTPEKHYKYLKTLYVSSHNSHTAKMALEKAIISAERLMLPHLSECLRHEARIMTMKGRKVALKEWRGDMLVWEIPDQYRRCENGDTVFIGDDEKQLKVDVIIYTSGSGIRWMVTNWKK